MFRIVIAACVAAGMSLSAASALAQSQGIVAIVNDQPVTARDIDQRIRLMKAFGAAAPSRKDALQSLVDDQVKITEARKLNIIVSDKMVEDRLQRMADNNKTDKDELLAKFGKQGVSATALRRYVTAEIAFGAWIQVKNKKAPEVDQAAVDREFNDFMAKYNEFMKRYNRAKSDPRMKGVTIYQVQEITFPVDSTDGSIDQSLLQSRAIEAAQFMQKYKGCKSAKAAAAGIFNVKIGQTIDADGGKLPKQLKAALDKIGPGKAIGPSRAPGGIQVIGFCGKRAVAAPKLPPPPEAPTRAAIERKVMSEQMDRFEETFLAELRQNAIIDYKDPAYTQ
jgi:peptidyl-prolyl cis-trans isomerase SurA